MKKYTKYLAGIIIFAGMSACLFSCSENIMDSINNDGDHTKTVEAKFIIADVLTSTAYYNVGGDFNTYLSVYVEHEVGIHNQLYGAEHRNAQPTSSSTFNNSWVNTYTSLKNSRVALDKCSEGGTESGNHVTRGIAGVMAAYNSALLADLFGDTPWSEAARVNSSGLPLYMNPKIDSQESIFNGIFEQLDEAISDLEGENATAIADYDFVYGGNKNNWTKFAYGLKARYTMRLINRSSSIADDMDKVLDYVSKSFSSADEQAAYAIYDATNLNPLFDFQWSRDALAASESLSQKLIERNDPRLRRIFIDADWVQITGDSDPEFFMAPNGEAEQLQYTYNTSAFVYSQTAPTLYLSYHELLFLKAEALCRLSRTAEAQDALKKAVVAAIENMEESLTAAMTAPKPSGYGGLEETTTAVTQAEAEAYFDNEVLPLFTANPLKETMIQKYLAFHGASGESTECYHDIRRIKALNENFVTLNNTKSFPLRLPYGSTDTTANPDVKEAFGDGQYVYSEQVWWAGGTR